MSVANINRVTVTGNLTRDPELKSVGGENSSLEVCEMRIAVNARRKQGDGWVDRPNYFDVAVWGARAKVCDDLLSRGRGVAIDGHLEWREWTGKDDKHHEAITIVADNIQFLWPRPKPEQQEPVAAAPASDVPADSSGFENPVPVAAAAGSDDDIPF